MPISINPSKTDQANPLQVWLNRYLDYLHTERHCSCQTVKSYARDLQLAIYWLTEQGIDDWSQLTEKQAQCYLASRHRIGQSAKTLHRELASLSSLFKYLIKENQATSNPTKGVRIPHLNHRLPATLEVEQISQLLDCDDTSPLCIRDLAIMELIYSSGLHVGELVNLNLGDIDLEEGLVHFLGKYAKSRILPMGRKAIAAIQRWLVVRSTMTDKDQVALFITRQGRRFRRSSVQSRLHDWYIKQGLPRNIYPFLLRHS